ncbi:4404_t:CDS:2 [Ambispora leptoticha]|uniref:Acyl-protein thioesterase 1 n=1 Tax=Ambispora leptoticha TaxID=144679 RepID=A0A9N8ZIU5_9GLOM|nr:4404_t:CDS:2 [Ambispora leptoticha]
MEQDICPSNPSRINYEEIIQSVHLDYPQLMRAADYVNEIVEEEIALGIPAEKIVLAGYSQGALLTLATALTTKHRLVVRKSLDLELNLWDDYPIIAGVDEAGRGALAGPIVVAAVVAVEYSVSFKSSQEVEVKNPLGATKEAMVEVILKLQTKPNLCLIDGKEEVKIEGIKTISVIGGDRKSINIAAASIIAKVILTEVTYLLFFAMEFATYTGKVMNR